MTTILEPIGAGITVALINKFIINNNWLWRICLGCQAEDVNKHDEHEECSSSTSTSTIDAVEVHTHF